MTEAERLTGLRDHFAGLGDRSLVAEVEHAAQRQGVTLGTTVAPLIELAVPRKERATRK